MDIAQSLVSVLMPVYNGEKCLSEAIDSILNQSFSNFELIILNDGSNDNSLKIITEYQKSDSRISVINRENRGVVFTRNQLIDEARGEWIAWMDQDDVSHVDRLREQLFQLESNNADICGCHWFIMNEQGKLVDARLMPLNSYSFVIFTISAVPFAHGSIMMRSKFIKAQSIKYGDYKYAEDCDFWSKMWRANAVFTNVNKFLYSYREAEQSFSKVNRKKNVNDSKIIRRKFIEDHPSLCADSIKNLILVYKDLSEMERVYLIVASYLLMICVGRFIFLSVLKVSSKKSIGLGILQLLKGV